MLFWVSNKFSENYHRILHIRIRLCTEFQFKLTILIFLDQICPRGVFPVKNKRSECSHWISLGTKFQHKPKIHQISPKRVYLVKSEQLLIKRFLDQIFPKRVFPFKNRKVNSTTEFCIFKLVLVPNFSLNWQFWFFGPNLPKKGISGWK